jgi:hypothetical protein
MGPNYSLPDHFEVVQIPAHLATDEGHILACVIAVGDLDILNNLSDDGYYDALWY